MGLTDTGERKGERIVNRARIGGLGIFMSAVLIATACGLAGTATDYPKGRPVEIIVPAPPGGGDIAARAIAEYLTKKWNHPVNVVNKPGGGTTTGTIEGLQAPADGHTIIGLFMSNSILNPAVQADLPFKWDDFTYIGMVARAPLVLVVKNDAPYRTAKDLADAVKRDPGQFSYGSSALGGPSTFGVAQFLTAAGIDATKPKLVTFNGGAPTLVAVAGGHVQFGAQSLAEVLELVRGGQLRPLMVSSDARVKELPDVPTAKEAGYAAFTQGFVFGIGGPSKLPAEIVAKWEKGLEDAGKDPEFIKKLSDGGNTSVYMNSRDYKSWTESQYKESLDVATKLGLRK